MVDKVRRWLVIHEKSCKKKKSTDPVLIVSGIFKMAIVTVRRGC